MVYRNFKAENCIYALVLALQIEFSQPFQTNLVICKKFLSRPLGLGISGLSSLSIASSRSIASMTLTQTESSIQNELLLALSRETNSLQSTMASLEVERSQALKRLEENSLNEELFPLPLSLLKEQSFQMLHTSKVPGDNIMFNLDVESIDFGCTEVVIDEVNQEDLARLKHEVEKLTAQHRSNLAWIRFLRSTERKSRSL
ncbi:hypothetical protein GUITHDRAFT_155268 [Guillardia theta CCMP2712]|uniref:Uncharacterized protein n=1 Tax=Guillardia theta (strain CCMP2712) TaxID=905079 RepID=L1IJI1_GUITC|nr:hypothetical protein GUITHDRAFT_155268 [Guillardia theta CCMP2712]EKX36386.1 hypothetical protein GUITHDRAFT_155268 [Guillardia theta CCMP2712]|mmetsp:Transcript_49218/g.154469  ORF Transcript_49218/g.154469 Transcript_49218/m.154469 type:complete len:201 (-) Transcript_49218:520-1122(-)|eukprot:XP_005823366.1 hypothetical protein GUITHDRAFT_155268 [Guillardia theta CCMP2712]